MDALKKQILTVGCLSLLSCFVRGQVAGTNMEPASTIASKPLVAVPKFDNRTASSSITLPEAAAEVAADEVSMALTNSQKFSVLSRSTFSIKKRNEEDLYAGNDASFKMFKDLKAKYLVLGALSGFRLDQTSGTAYGVSVDRITARITLDIRAVDVETGQIIYQAAPTESISMRNVDGTTSTLPKDWEALLRAAVRKSADDMIEKLLVGSGVAAPAAIMINVPVTSSPEGADILMDGAFVGNTPATIQAAEGLTTLTIQRQGYQPWERRVKVFEGLKVAPVLEKIPTSPTPIPTED